MSNATIAQETLNTYFELDAQIRELEAKRDAIKKTIKDAMSEQGIDKYTDVQGDVQTTVSLTQATRTTISYKDFAAVHPRLAKKFAKVTSYETLSIRRK